MLSISTGSRLSQGLSDNISHINYLTRSAARTPTLPKDRQLDYFWRDTFLSVVTIYAFDASYALVEALYANPEIVRTLGLNKIAESYASELKKAHPSLSTVELAKKYNFSQMPVALEAFKTSNLMDSFVPERFAHTLARNSEPSNSDKMQQLKKHLFRKMHYEQFLADYKKADLDAVGVTAKEIVQHVDAVFKAVAPSKKKHDSFKWDKPHTWFNKFYLNSQEEMTLLEEGRFQRAVKQHLPEHMKKIGAKEQRSEKLEALLLDGLKSKRAMTLLKHLKGSNVLPGFLAGLGINLFYYGMIGNWMDFQVVQPWQKKISKELGGVDKLMGPAYAALIPWAVTFLALKSGPTDIKKMLPELGPLQRFALSTTLGLGVYTASTIGFVKARLNHLRAQKHQQMTEVYKPSVVPAHSLGVSLQRGLPTAFPLKTIGSPFDSTAWNT